MNDQDATRAAGSSAPACSPPPHELACRMLNAIGWNGNDFRLRDPVALAIAPEVERINRRANMAICVKGCDIERAYCMSCRREIMTEAGHICPSCANKVPTVSGELRKGQTT